MSAALARLAALSAGPAPVDLALPAGLPAARDARVALDGLAARLLPAHRREDVCVAVSEAVTNAAVHAYDGAGTVWVRGLVRGGSLAVSVRDAGRGFDPVAGLRGPRTGLGVGLRVIRGLADEAAVVVPPGGGTTVLMLFRP